MMRHLSKKSFSIFLVLLCAVCGVHGAFPGPQGYVSDYAGIIGGEYKAAIEALISELESKTSAEIAVVTMKNLGGSDPEGYAADLFQKWGIGKKDKDNGLLIITALEERAVRIEVGYGLEGIIPDGLAGRVIREKILPEFKDGNYGQGLLNGVKTCAAIIAKDAGAALAGAGETDAELPADFMEIINFIAVVLFVLMIIGARIFFPLLFGFGGFWTGGSGGFGGGGGGFGGFGGGLSGGGGATGRW